MFPITCRPATPRDAARRAAATWERRGRRVRRIEAGVPHVLTHREEGWAGAADRRLP